MRPAAFAKVLRQQSTDLERNMLEAAGANAQLLGSRIREHIVRDDLPLTALSPEWVRFKLSRGKPRAHLHYTGNYLSNFRVERIKGGFTVGTNRPTVSSSFNLPEYLESKYPVWQLSADEARGDTERNAQEAVDATLDARAPRFKRQ